MARALLVWVCLALVALAIIAAPVAAEDIVIENLPYTDENEGQEFGYHEETVTYAHTASGSSGSLVLALDQVQNFQHIHYCLMEYPGDMGTEGYSDVWYARPSDGTYQKGVVQCTKTRNALNQVTKSVISFYPTNWDIGTKTGAYSTTILADNNGVKGTTSYIYFSNVYKYYAGSTDSTGDTKYGGKLYLTRQAGQTNFFTHIEAYSSSYYKFTLDKSFSSLNVDLIRTKNGVNYPSTIEISDGTSVLISDSTSADKNFLITPARYSYASVSIAGEITRYFYSEDSGGATEQEYFTLSLSPENGIGSPITAALTPATDAPAYDYINWRYLDPGSPYETTFQKISGTWKKYNPETQAYDIAVTGTEYLTPTFTPTQAGYTYIACQVYDLAGKKKVADLIEYVTVSDKMTSDKFPVDLQVFDADTGGGLLRVNLDVKNLQTGETTSTLIQTESVGYRLMLQVGSTYDLTVSKSGYESRTFTRVGSTTKTLTAHLPKSVSSDPEKVWMYFYVLDGSQAPISGAAVQLSGLSTTLTNSQGLAKIAVSTNTTYQYTVSQTDYTGVSDEIIIESTSQWKYVTLTPTGAAVTSPVPTGPGTVTTPDYRSIDEKATSALSILFDHVELFAALAGLVLLCNMLFWIVPGGKR